MAATIQASRPTKIKQTTNNEATTSKHYNQQTKSSNQKERWG
jgi:hypothetical protein